MLRKIFGSMNDRYIKKISKTVKRINQLEPTTQKLSDAELQAKTTEFKNRFAGGETLEDLLPEAFAVVREASKRVLGLRPFDVQLMGGIILNAGKITEMKTGEGKTLVATMPAYLNALTGRGVHVVTVNDYLASRDSAWMGKLYQFLGLTVGCIVHDMTPEERQKAYAADITYATNNELGFDYLRDNMCLDKAEMVQRPFSYAIVDEVDSILIDEARTPLIISGQADDASERYQAVDEIIKNVRPEHYEKDEKHKTVTLTDAGVEFVEDALHTAGLMQGGLYDLDNISWVHHTEQALKAHTLFTRDVDYIVKDDQVVIIDEFTGRMMAGRRYSDGLHQAIEAKEHVKIQPENQTLASITFQNYFRLYPKLSGMTGTALTEAVEFDSIYHLEVIEVPTNVPCARKDDHDFIYRTAEEKYAAIIEEIKKAHAKGQPVLVGTTSIEKSELLADLLRKETDIPFQVLNARHHEQEAKIIAQAGVPGAVTIATNMAGRGTDIQLGGNLDMRLAEELEKDPSADPELLKNKLKEEIAAAREQVLKAGGLYVLGSERHESRRIDNQLRGRSGRQGDPGLSRFYISLQDDLMRIFGSERLSSILKTLGMPKGESITHPWISKAIAKAQQKVETYHFDIRKNLLKYDDVMNEQRKVIYEQRRELLNAESVSDMIAGMRMDSIESMVYSLAPPRTGPADWSAEALQEATLRLLGISPNYKDWLADTGLTPEDICAKLNKLAEDDMQARFKGIPENIKNLLEKNILVRTIDQMWKEHLQILDFMRTSIGLRAYGQRDPLNEYKRESFLLFENLLSKIRERVTMVLMRAQFQLQETAPAPTAKPAEHPPVEGQDIPRNAPCPCGSGKKYKNCCGALD